MSGGSNRRFKFDKRRQLFIRMHNETLSIVAMCVNNEDCSPAVAEVTRSRQIQTPVP